MLKVTHIFKSLEVRKPRIYHFGHLGSCLITYLFDLLVMYIKNLHCNAVEEEASNRESGPDASEVMNYMRHV